LKRFHLQTPKDGSTLYEESTAILLFYPESTVMDWVLKRLEDYQLQNRAGLHFSPPRDNTGTVTPSRSPFPHTELSHIFTSESYFATSWDGDRVRKRNRRILQIDNEEVILTARENVWLFTRIERFAGGTIARNTNCGNDVS